MTEMSVMRKEAQEALLDLFASITRLPVGLYMSSNGQMEALFSPGALANFEAVSYTHLTLPTNREV